MYKVLPNLTLVASENIDRFKNKRSINKFNRKNPDALFKELFKIKEFVIDFLKNIVDGDLAKYLDFDTIEVVNTELINDAVSNIKRIVDVLYKIKFKNEEAYVFIILEIQSTVNKNMAARMHTYIALFTEYLLKSGQIKDGHLLPLIFPIVFYDNVKTWNATTRLQDLYIKLPNNLKEFEKYIPKLEYCLIDLSKIEKDKLLECQDSLIAQMALIEIETDIAQNHVRYIKAIELIKDNENYLSTFRIWFKMIMERKGEVLTLEDIIQEEIEMIKHKPENIYKDWLQRVQQEGRLEGKLEGEIAGKAETLLKLINVKFGQIPCEIDSKIKNLTLFELDNCLIRLLSANSVEDIFESKN